MRFKPKSKFGSDLGLLGIFWSFRAHFQSKIPKEHVNGYVREVIVPSVTPTRKNCPVCACPERETQEF